MIASPGDVAKERQLIATLVHEWNVVNAQDRHTVLMPLTWETHSTPGMGGRGQEIINHQVLDKCDLLVGVFWTRLGSPTGVAPSGTVEEIRKHVAAGKPAMIYFSGAPVQPESIDLTQYQALQEFRKECEKSGLIAKYESVEDFANKFSRHLAQIVRDRFAGAPSGEVSIEVASGNRPGSPSLSDEAKRLLVAAAESEGTVMRIRVMGGTIIQAGQTTMAPMEDRRAIARWESALGELTVNGLLIDRGHKGEIFEVTDRGYTLADALKS
jgi:hypothetical protein